MTERIDIGHGHAMVYTGWHPEDLPGNREAFGVPLPSIDRCGVLLYHPNQKDATAPECSSFCHFDLPEVRRWFKNTTVWQVIAWEPLTLSPSIRCMLCGDHGFLRQGKWVPA